jgi:penicillin-insensitive murein endopeptidase
MPDDPWKRVATPTTEAPDSIGFYSAGCLRGAVRLPLSGPNYQVMRASRHRYYGHPTLLEFIKALALELKGHGLQTLVVGDMGQPRGGPTMSGHASHQTGLDVDIWYRQLPEGKKLTMTDREKLKTPDMVDGDFDNLNSKWNPKEMDVLKLASEQPDVERIFVNPVIKQAICSAHKGEPWLSKLRPELGHGDHFHVRLKCPSDSQNCKDQEAPPAGDGCDKSLDDWFTPDNKAKVKYDREHPKPPTMPTLPPLCGSVLKE